MKRPILFALIIISSGIILTGCSLELGQSATTPPPETRLSKCYNPHPTRSPLYVDYPSRTSDLMPEISIRTGRGSTITVEGPLGVYTTTNGLVQVELIPEAANKFEVSATFRATVHENRCIWQGHASNKDFLIFHSYDDATVPTHTPTPDSEG